MAMSKEERFNFEGECQRCKHHLHQGSRKSWFIPDQILCDECYERERELIKQLRKEGRDTEVLHHCGYLPSPITKNWR